MGTAFVAAVALTLSPPALVAKAVAANEALYRDVDVTYQTSYRLAESRSGGVLLGSSGEVVGRLILKQEATARVVRRGELFRVVTTTRTEAGDAPTTRVHGAAFDGATTVTREGNRTEARAGPGRLPQEVYFPHLWASGPMFHRFPLSVFLAGGAAWDTHPGRDSAFEGKTVTRTLMAPGAVGAEPCVVVRCVAAQFGRATGADFYWLSPGKNYLPVRVVKVSYYYSTSMPVEVVEAADHRELRPGVWLPFRVTKTVYDGLELRENHRSVVSNTTVTTVTRAALDPNHGPAFFRDLRADGE